MHITSSYTDYPTISTFSSNRVETFYHSHKIIIHNWSNVDKLLQQRRETAMKNSLWTSSAELTRAQRSIRQHQATSFDEENCWSRAGRHVPTDHKLHPIPQLVQDVPWLTRAKLTQNRWMCKQQHRLLALMRKGRPPGVDVPKSIKRASFPYGSCGPISQSPERRNKLGEAILKSTSTEEKLDASQACVLLSSILASKILRHIMPTPSIVRGRKMCSSQQA